MKENEEWNKQVALLREERLTKVQEARKESILMKLIASEERQKEQLEKAEQIVREQKVISLCLTILKYEYNNTVHMKFKELRRRLLIKVN
jgi:hypothetical protein